jgi:hypothetical protein
MRILVWVLASYFGLSLAALAASRIDLPPAFYALSLLLLPLIWLSRLFQPILSPLGLWSNAGSGGWVNYEGPSFVGLLLIAGIGFALTVFLLLRTARNG